jgi:tRNA A37 threonylcarbamoyladenosine modification protein TsaB
MSLPNYIFFDFSLDQKYILILSQDKLYKKKLESLKRSENIATIFFEFIKKNQIKIDNTFSLFVNVGPGNLIAIRNSVVFTKILSLILGCKLLGFSNYQLFKFNKKKTSKALLSLGTRKLLLDISMKKAKRLCDSEISKFKNYKYKISYNKKILKNLIMSKNFVKKVFPISYSNV